MTDNHSPRSEHVTSTDTPILMHDGGTARHRKVLSESELKESFPDWREQIRHSERLNAQSAETVAPEDVLQDRLASRLGHDL